MFITDLKQTEAVDITPEGLKDKGSVTVQWMLGEPEGAPNFELRYFALNGDVATDRHSHAWEHQVFVIEGRGKLCTAEEEYDLVPGAAVLVAPNELHHFACAGDRFEFICVVPKGTRVCAPADGK